MRGLESARTHSITAMSGCGPGDSARERRVPLVVGPLTRVAKGGREVSRYETGVGGEHQAWLRLPGLSGLWGELKVEGTPRREGVGK